MTDSPTSPSRLEQNSPHPPGPSSQNGQNGQPPSRPADIRARQPPRCTTTTTAAREFLPHPRPNAPRLPRPVRAAAHTHQVLAYGRDQPVCSDSRSVGRTQPRRLETQPLLNHMRQSYGSCAYTALNDHRTLTCSYLDKERSAWLSRRSYRPIPRQIETRSERPGLTCGSMGGRSRVRTWVGLADGFTDRSLWPLGQPASCRHTGRHSEG